MKKTFSLTHEKIAPVRLIESVKSDVRKYLKRERAKALPKGADFWDFDCRFGADADNSKVVHVAEIDAALKQAEEQKLESCYIEIIAKPGYRTPKSV